MEGLGDERKAAQRGEGDWWKVGEADPHGARVGLYAASVLIDVVCVWVRSPLVGGLEESSGNDEEERTDAMAIGGP